jgi:hypothetical protein
VTTTSGQFRHVLDLQLTFISKGVCDDDFVLQPVEYFFGMYALKDVRILGCFGYLSIEQMLSPKIV